LRQVQVSGSQGGLVGLLPRSVRVFKHFVCLEVGSGKAARSHPAHQRVTLTFGQQKVDFQ
jgi:hypothetical protein